MENVPFINQKNRPSAPPLCVSCQMAGLKKKRRNRLTDDRQGVLGGDGAPPGEEAGRPRLHGHPQGLDEVEPRAA